MGFPSLESSAGVNYVYDGDGKRVEKSSLPAGAGGTLHWYGLNSAPMEETNLTGGMLRDYIFFGGERISVYTPTSAILAFFNDHLGSTSKFESVSSAGAVTLEFDADYAPFGRVREFGSDLYDPAFKFMGKEYDGETGLDNFGARYNDPTIGRFISAAKRAPRSTASRAWEIGRAVPAPVPYANLTNPQTLNLYAMVSDNPETFADLDGHVTCGQTLPGSNEDCTKTAPSPAATTGGNDPGSNTTGDGVNNSTNLALSWMNVIEVTWLSGLGIGGGGQIGPAKADGVIGTETEGTIGLGGVNFETTALVGTQGSAQLTSAAGGEIKAGLSASTKDGVSLSAEASGHVGSVSGSVKVDKTGVHTGVGLTKRTDWKIGGHVHLGFGLGANLNLSQLSRAIQQTHQSFQALGAVLAHELKSYAPSINPFWK